MTTLDQAINGTVTRDIITIKEVLKFADFFKDGQGNRYTLQLCGELANDGTGLYDVYELYRDHHHNVKGAVHEGEHVELCRDNGKNICYIVINNINLYPYVCKPVML